MKGMGDGGGKGLGRIWEYEVETESIIYRKRTKPVFNKGSN